MKTRSVSELMVPVSSYATISQDASLYQAVEALEEAHEKFSQNRYQHRAVLIRDETGQLVGKLSELDVLGGLEPKYKDIGDLRSVSRSGFTTEFLKSMLSTHRLWQKPLVDICRKAAEIQVKDIGYTPVTGKCVREDATLDEAVHLLIIGNQQNLLVTKAESEEIIGVLQLSDIFSEVSNMIKSCKL